MFNTSHPLPVSPRDLPPHIANMSRRCLEAPPDPRLSSKRAGFRPQSASATAPYPLGTAPVNNKMTTLERVRTENTWLREELECLQKELASEKHISQYRWRSYECKLADSEAKRAATEATFVQAQKDNKQMIKRREGIVHRVKDEERTRRQVRERLVRRLFHSELQGCKKGSMADWLLTSGGVGDYFSEWRRSSRKSCQHDADQAGDHSEDGEIFKTREDGRSLKKRLRRLEQQRTFLLRQERRSLSPEHSPDRHRYHASSQVGTVPAANPVEESVQHRESLSKKLEGEDALTAHSRVGQAACTKAFDTHSTFVNVDFSEEQVGVRKKLLGCDEAMLNPILTQREKDFLATATREICMRRRLERAFEEERSQIRQHVRSSAACPECMFHECTFQACDVFRLDA